MLLVGCAPGPDQEDAADPGPAVEAGSDGLQGPAGSVDAERIINADREPRNWLAHGRTYSEQRYSPLDQINADNADRLGLAWFFDTGTDRGLEATPIVVDGMMFTSGSWSVVFANDARTGELIWKYDPQVPREWGANACCDVVNRGVAVWEGKVFVGALDGRLLALDATDGSLVWEVNTIDRSYPYTITGAPRVVKGKVIIGNGGAEYGVRGYVTAYDADSGKEAWRFYTVPGNPADGFENEAMERAANTWTGEWWKYGGGGTVWDSMAYDPELNLLYIGTGNGSPWNRAVRSPGGGDNLYLSSIVALNPDTGAYVWHYQTTPGDTWDYTATQHMILADLVINGVERKVILQAPKNGFFYVLDRTDGEFISASPYVPVTWATHIDVESGKPVETENARYQMENPLADMTPEEQLQTLKAMDAGEMEKAFHKPGPLGGHNWHPMSYSPQTGLVYIPALDIPFTYANDPAFKYVSGRWNLGIDFLLNASLDDAELDGRVDQMIRGHVAAWDPVENREVWRIQHPGTWNGGVLTTAGNLLFQGNSAGKFAAYRADTGERLWEAPAQTGVIAPPVTYEVDGEQYVTVVAGWGGAFAITAGTAETYGHKPRGRILTYKLGGELALPPLPAEARVVDPPPLTASTEQINQGKNQYHLYCSVCHGPGVRGGGVIPDLRYMSNARYQVFREVVLDGILKERGMVPFADVLTEEDVDAIRSYVISRAQVLRSSMAESAGAEE